MNIHLEYIWTDGNNPQHLRSKTKIIQKDVKSQFDSTNQGKSLEDYFIEWKNNPESLPTWNFDGSSTDQATTQKSELLLKPVNIFKDPFKFNHGFLVLCEVYNTDWSIHKTNTRASMINTLEKWDDETMYGFEQEYFIYDNLTSKPVGWPKDGFPEPQGNYYCAVGGNHVNGRDFVDDHAKLCEVIGLELSGINAEVALGQWEYQIGPVYAKEGSDQLWISRYILERLSEKYNYYIVLDPKPYVGNNWNGSGMHVNFSTKTMREDLKNKKKLVIEACERLSEKVEEHILVYGKNNELRLTGHNETCSINEYRFGIGDRTASIRIPSSIDDKTTPGYLEDRRPASNADPYQVVERMVKTICKPSNQDKIKSKIKTKSKAQSV
jgi:glutamine synthetase